MKDFFSKFIRSEKFYLLIVTTVACTVMLPIFFKGIPYGWDLPHHFQCAYSYYEGFLTGDFYPSWSASRNLGYGGMELRLYPPLSHYSLAVFYLLTRDWHTALWLTVTFYSVLGSLGVYLWARELMTTRNALFAGCFFALMPYHLNQIYNTFFFAEYVGCAVLPFSFWLVYRVAIRGGLLDVAGLAAAFAVLILAHLPLTLIGSTSFLIYGLSLLKRDKFLLQIGKLSAGVLLGLAATSFFWIKVVQEGNLMAKTLIYADPWIDYRLHFLITPLQNYTEKMSVNVYQSATSFYDLTLFYTFVLVVLPGALVLIWNKGKGEFRIKSIWIIFSISVFFTTLFSKFLWDKFSLLQEVQFPWRWMAVVSVVAAVLSANNIDVIIEWIKGEKRPLALIIAGTVFAFAAFSVSKVIVTSPFIPIDVIELSMRDIQKAKGFPFWWTIWARTDAVRNLEKVTANSRSVQIQNWQSTERDFQISAGKSEDVRIATFYHPNWKATVNKSPVEIQPDENGAILIPLPQQNSKVKLHFQETLAQQIGQWVSGFVFLLLSFFGLVEVILRNRNNHLESVMYRTDEAEKES